MMNSYSVARSHPGGAAAITLHFNCNNNKSNNNNSNNNSSLKPIVTATKEHKSQQHKNIINSAAPTTTTLATATTTATTTSTMFKITQNEVDAKHFLQQKQQQQLHKGGSVNWLVPGVPSYVNTSASTKEPQFIQVNVQSSSSNNTQQVQSTTAITKSAFIEVMTMPLQQQQRTEDQENAFRQIEDVHNYAKLQHHHHHQHQQHCHDISSDEMGEEDEDEDDDEEDEELELGEEDEEELELDVITTTTTAATTTKKQKINANVPKNINFNNNNITNDDDSEDHVEVDVVTVTPTTPQQQQQLHLYQEQEQQSSAVDQDMRPEHHARRPMNAFLIFCKRHRAIVKERYKSLENRAITKILGDWWAALDDQEKQCFTDLAQQNKDAFFNANPNFKWYKLPAPPLRTLATRPSNTVATNANDEQQQQQSQHQQQQWEPNEVAHVLRRNYFKFADETQMGELSVLLSGNAGNVQDKDYALQQALSETTQFLSVHMPSKNNNNNTNTNNNSKRCLQTADSASNSSEEEERGSPGKKLKSSRSCKGKIYQELINSGQLAAIAKKSKCRLNSDSNTPPISPTTAATFVATATDCQQQLLDLKATTATTRETTTTTVANRHNKCDSSEFDLEEKIKELPALSLDAYLQRKRSTKKKKKFSSSKKQRNSNSSSSATAATTGEQLQKFNKQTRNKSESEVTTTITATAAAAATAATTTTAVGSQKRKARKESITRRDVSAIEQEVASILPLTINGCYYFNQSLPLQPAAVARVQPTTTAQAARTATTNAATFDVTSTSDLLILAEVAANRTELTKSN